MEQWYDKEEDILGVRLQEKEYWKSIELANGIVIDVSRDGGVIGIEIPKASTVFSKDAKKVIDSSSH